MTVDPTSAFGITAPGHRLPAGLRLGPVALQVGDLDRSMSWYRQTLGLAPIAAGPGRTWLGAAVPLIELRARPGARPAPLRSRVGLYHFALLVPGRDDLGRLVRHLAEQGIPFGASDHAVSEAIYLRDPDGLGIEVYSDRPRAAWRTRPTARGRELVMETAPLDLEGLVAAAGSEAWHGMPAGTVMGHVHLHVADLERAREFYHRTLGLDEVVWSYPGALFLSAGGYHHHLGLNTWAGAEARAPEDGEARLAEWTARLPAGSWAALQDALVAAGVTVRGAGGGSLVADPWGTIIRLVEDG